MSTPAPLRLPRALALAGTATTVGAASHLLTGGALNLAGIVGTLPVLTALAWPLTGRERGWLAILGVQLAGQQAAHAVFELTAGAAHDPALPMDAWLYGHVLAAVVVATWLRHAERRTWAAARRAAAAIAAFWQGLLALVPPDPAHPAVPAPPVAASPVRPPLRHSVVRRGPPVPA